MFIMKSADREPGAGNTSNWQRSLDCNPFMIDGDGDHRYLSALPYLQIGSNAHARESTRGGDDVRRDGDPRVTVSERKDRSS